MFSLAYEPRQPNLGPKPDRNGSIFLLTCLDHPNLPTITFPEDLQENTLVTFNCSSPYACAYDSISLQWAGYKAESSHVSKKVQMNTDGVCQKQTLKTWVSWQDHNRKINCKLSVGTQVVVNELTLSVKRECLSPGGMGAAGGHFFPLLH